MRTRLEVFAQSCQQTDKQRQTDKQTTTIAYRPWQR